MAQRKHIEAESNGKTSLTASVSLDQRRRSAITHSHRIAHQLQAGPDMGQVVSLYRLGMPQTEIAQVVVPDVVQISAQVAVRAIGHALSEELPVQEREDIALANRRRAQAAYISRREKRTLHRSAEMAGKRIRWTTEEKARMNELRQKEEFLHHDGSMWDGKPNYDLIAQVLNAEFHNGQLVRAASQVSQKVNDMLYAPERKRKRAEKRAKTV